MKDTRLPTTDEELRDWLAAAWVDGWRARRSLVGKPMGTVEHERPKRLDAFLASWDLPPMPKPKTMGVRAAIQALADMAHDEHPDTDEHRAGCVECIQRHDRKETGK